MDEPVQTAWNWGDSGRCFFPEDELLRLAGFRLKGRPKGGEALWVHYSGTQHTHKDAIEWLFTQYDYEKTDDNLFGEMLWRHTGRNTVHTREAIVKALREWMLANRRELSRRGLT